MLGCSPRRPSRTSTPSSTAARVSSASTARDPQRVSLAHPASRSERSTLRLRPAGRGMRFALRGAPPVAGAMRASPGALRGQREPCSYTTERQTLMTFTEAAAQVLRLVGKPLHYKEITDVAIEKNLLSHVGKSPEVTMGARLAALVKKGDKENPLVRVKPGVFALREWDPATDRKGARRSHAGARAPGGAASERARRRSRSTARKRRSPRAAPPSDERRRRRPRSMTPERERAELAAHATELLRVRRRRRRADLRSRRAGAGRRRSRRPTAARR